MKILEEKIARQGIILPGDVLKVGHFINQQIDQKLLRAMAEEFARLFADEHVTKVLTVEASGIAIAAAVSLVMDIPMVFAKKGTSSNVSGVCYSAPVMSYTHGKLFQISVPKDYISADDRILIVDDFLATGSALIGLTDIVKSAGATVAGCGIIIEKVYQSGGAKIRESGIRVESLARIASMDADTGTITFS